MRILVVAVVFVIPGLVQAQVPASVRARAQVVDAQPSRAALGAVRSLRSGLTEGRVADAGLAVLAERTVPSQPMGRPWRGAVVEINFLRN